MALSRALAGNDTAVVSLLTRAAVPPGAAIVVADPRVRHAWNGFLEVPDRTSQAPSRRALVPELTFTIEDDFPDLVRTRVVTPQSGPRRR